MFGMYAQVGEWGAPSSEGPRKGQEIAEDWQLSFFLTFRHAPLLHRHLH